MSMQMHIGVDLVVEKFIRSKHIVVDHLLPSSKPRRQHIMWKMNTFYYLREEKEPRTAACSLETVLGSCSKNKLFAPTVESVSKYWLNNRISITSLGEVPFTSLENSETEFCNPCTMAFL